MDDDIVSGAATGEERQKKSSQDKPRKKERSEQKRRTQDDELMDESSKASKRALLPPPLDPITADTDDASAVADDLTTETATGGVDGSRPAARDDDFPEVINTSVKVVQTSDGPERVTIYTLKDGTSMTSSEYVRTFDPRVRELLAMS